MCGPQKYISMGRVVLACMAVCVAMHGRDKGRKLLNKSDWCLKTSLNKKRGLYFMSLELSEGF